jgi:hypothetical protein
MANPTTNYGFVLPTSTDLVTDLPADFDVALQGVDTRLKDLQPGTTLGDLAYSSATANTNTRLGIGTTGQLLTVAGGVPSWAAAPASSPTSGEIRVDTGQTTTSTSYVALATAQAVTVTTGTKVLVIVSAGIKAPNYIGVTESFASFAISGATTRAASDTWAASAGNTGGMGGAAFFQYSYASFQTVTAGSNTFTAQFRTTQSTPEFRNRQLIVIDLGS